jgi:hypothetical protein
MVVHKFFLFAAALISEEGVALFTFRAMPLEYSYNIFNASSVNPGMILVTPAGSDRKMNPTIVMIKQ